MLNSSEQTWSVICPLQRGIPELRALDDLSSGSVDNLHACAAELVTGSILDGQLLAEAADGLDAVVAPSSAAAYGADPTFPKHETLPRDPRSPHAASKPASEHAATAYAAVILGDAAHTARSRSTVTDRESVPRRPGDVGHSRADASRLCELFPDAQPRTSLTASPRQVDR